MRSGHADALGKAFQRKPFSVGEVAKQPFEQPHFIESEPQDAEHSLENPDADGDPHQLRETEASHVAEAVEQRSRDDGLADIIGQRQSPDSRQSDRQLAERPLLVESDYKTHQTKRCR
ncbi:hypothetical protein D3C80_1578510 [compost metagenome]